MLIDFRERGRGSERGKERNIDVREKYQSVATHMHLCQESKPQPKGWDVP